MVSLGPRWLLPVWTKAPRLPSGHHLNPSLHSYYSSSHAETAHTEVASLPSIRRQSWEGKAFYNPECSVPYTPSFCSLLPWLGSGPLSTVKQVRLRVAIYASRKERRQGRGVTWTRRGGARGRIQGEGGHGRRGLGLLSEEASALTPP